MGGFGERLRREREMRGIALDEISTATKISNRFLRALEEEKFDLLPGGIFNKGFVRAYAKFLGIDEEQAVADYTAAAGVPLESEQNGDLSETLERWKRPEPEELKEKRKEERSSWSAIAVVVVLGSLVFAGWTYYAKRKAEHEARETEAAAAAQAAQQVRPPAPVEAEPEKPAAPATSPVEKPRAAAPSGATSSASNLSNKPAVSASGKPTTVPGSTGKPFAADSGVKAPTATISAATIPGNAKPTTTSKPGAAATNPAATVASAAKPGETSSKEAAAPKVEPAKTEAPPAKAPIHLVLRAKQDSWVSVTADGRLVMKDTLAAGTEKSVRATGEVVLVLGNAAGIEVLYNGRALPALGDQGQVKTVTFTPEGYQ
ncbi:MAG TPA: RodZ domain-containing protein [Terriglobales bacterium]|nr:RodZ domain-containing protein [Terriglobales bacterium]